MEEIERRLKPEPVTIKTEFDLISHDYAGSLIIKEALIAGAMKSTEECKLSVFYHLNLVWNQSIPILYR